MKGKKIVSSLLVLALAGTATSAMVLSACNNGGEEATGKTYYVSPTGTATATGTKDDPYAIRTLLSVDDTTPILQPGDTVLVEPGDYNLWERILITYSGTYDKPITIKNADPTKKATIKFYDMDFSSLNRGVSIYGDHFIWDSIDIAGAGDNGMYIGGDYNVIQNCEFYDNRDTGLQLGRSYSEYDDISQWPHHNLIKNCTSYNNYDNETYGENADGFAAKLTVGYGNVFDGCIAYRNSDDGWDLYAKTDSGNIGQVIMYNCVAFENGYIMESQADFNKKFPTYRSQYNEAHTEYFSTRDGDGNGFKLGGSVMEGEVLLYNCLSFNNRMHGVTDNSNPGVITIDGVTSFNNAASVDNNPESSTYGYIAYGSTAADECANIDLARQTYSYNHVANTLSVNKDNSNVNADAYRGTVENSKFWWKNPNNGSAVATYTVEGQAEYNTKTGDYGVSGSELNATEIFKAIPALNLGLSNTIHSTYRNEDLSINMGEILAQKNGNSTYGSFLDKTSWDAYTHYEFSDLSTAKSEDDAIAMAVYDMVYLPIRSEACYQDFKAVTKMLGATITWTSSDSSLIEVSDVKGTSYSKHEDVLVKVHRPVDADKTATLTATVTMGNVTKTKSFEINVKKNTYRIGEFVIEGLDGGDMIVDKGEFSYSFKVPTPEIKNDTSNSGNIIDSSLYTRDRYVKYAADSVNFVSQDRFDATKAGIWEIEEVITLKDSVALAKSKDGSTLAPKVVSKTYYIYVAARDAAVDFSGTVDINVNRDGFNISGGVTSPTGYLYTYAVAAGSAAPTAAEVIANGIKNEFRATSVSFNVAQDNSAAYDVYYVMQSLDESQVSTVKSKSIITQDINTKADFEAILESNASNVIYLLKNDIDCGGTLKTSTTPFVGLFNGMGHKISNVTLTNTTDDKHDNIPGEGIFKQVNGGTIMNVTFEDITINDIGPKTGIIALMYGGYVSNVRVHNINLTSAQRAGALIGQVIAKSGNGATTYIDNVEVINDHKYVEVVTEYKQTTNTVTEKDFESGNVKYYVLSEDKYVLATAFDAAATYYEFVKGVNAQHFERGKFFTLSGENYVLADTYDESATYYTYKYIISGDRSSAIVGFIQAGSTSGWNIVYISNCYVDARIESGDYCGGIVGRSDDRNAKDYLTITNCYFNGNISCLKRAGGILGGFTGNGITRISDCLSIGTFYYADPRAEVEVAQKNCSCIVGNYAGNADMLVDNCYGKFLEYNSNYDVDIAVVSFMNTKKYNFFTEWLDFDMENTWEYVENPDNDKLLSAPYIKLR